MVTKQCVFKDEEGSELGGIYVENGDNVYIICGCCGGVFDLTDITGLKLFDNWVDIEEEIRGDNETLDIVKEILNDN